LILLNGLIHPYLSALFGLIWVIGRIIYGYGYASSGVKGRNIGGAVIFHLKLNFIII
jgi:uncharacterized membrane protein YecN with MAPEG domain